MTNRAAAHWLTNQDLADRFGVPLDTIRKWRYTNRGPTGVRFGVHVRYALDEVERWEREQAAKQVRAAS